SGDIPVALAELRKAGCGIVCAHQFQSQLSEADEKILSAVRNCTNVKIGFRVKDHQEATDLAEMLVPLDLEKPIDVLVKETVVRYERGLLRNGSTTSSTGTSASSARSVTDSVAETRTRGTSRGVTDSVTDSVTESQSITLGENESTTRAKGTSHTVGESEV